MWSQWPPATLSVAAATKEDSFSLQQKTEAMSIKFVTGDVPEQAEPHAALLNCRDFVCNLPAIPDEMWPTIQSRRQDKGHLVFNPGTGQGLC